MVRVLGRKKVWRASPDCTHDDKGMYLDAHGVRFVDDVLKWIEARLNRRPITQRFKRIEIPGITASPHLNEDGIRFGSLRVINNGDYVSVVIQSCIESIDPERAIFGPYLCRYWTKVRYREEYKCRESNSL